MDVLTFPERRIVLWLNLQNGTWITLFEFHFI